MTRASQMSDGVHSELSPAGESPLVESRSLPVTLFVVNPSRAG